MPGSLTPILLCCETLQSLLTVNTLFGSFIKVMFSFVSHSVHFMGFPIMFNGLYNNTITLNFYPHVFFLLSGSANIGECLIVLPNDFKIVQTYQ